MKTGEHIKADLGFVGLGVNVSYEYDESGNQTREVYYASDGSVNSRT